MSKTINKMDSVRGCLILKKVAIFFSFLRYKIQEFSPDDLNSSIWKEFDLIFLKHFLSLLLNEKGCKSESRLTNHKEKTENSSVRPRKTIKQMVSRNEIQQIFSPDQVFQSSDVGIFSEKQAEVTSAAAQLEDRSKNTQGW